MLCEFYLCNVIIVYYNVCDPNPHVQYVQLRAFMSFTRNQVRWNGVVYYGEHIEKEYILWVRGSPSIGKLFTERGRVMHHHAFVNSLEASQEAASKDFIEWIPRDILESAWF